MLVAVGYEDGYVFDHFGRTPAFMLYTIENDKVINQELLDCNGISHGALTLLLKQNNVDVLITDGMGQGARDKLEALDIDYYTGVYGKADEVIQDFIHHTLDYDLDAVCNHDHCHVN